MRNSAFSDIDLVPQLRDALPRIEAACDRFDTPILLYQALRDPFAQARAFRASRTTAEITARAKVYDEAGYPALARILWSVGPQYGHLGKHVTHAGPGESLHQYGRAVDGCPMIDGRLAWSYPDADRRAAYAWQVYGEAAELAGLNWGGRWLHVDMPHVQLGRGNPLKLLDRADVEGWIERWEAAGP